MAKACRSYKTIIFVSQIIGQQQMRNILIVLLSMVVCQAASQTLTLDNIDSLDNHVNELLQQAEYDSAYWQIHATSEVLFEAGMGDSLRNYIQHKLDDLPEDADTLMMSYGWILYIRAMAIVDLGDAANIRDAFLRQMRLLESIGCKDRNMANCYKHVAQGWFNMGQSEGIPYLNKAIDLFQELDDHKGSIYSYLAMVNLMSSLQLKDLSMRYLELCEEIYHENELNEYSVLADIRKRIGITYDEQGDHEKAIEVFKNAFALYQEHDEYTRDAGLIAANVALSAVGGKQWDVVEKYTRIATRIFEKFYGANSAMIAHIYLTMGEGFLYSGQLDSADLYLNKSQAIYLEQLGPKYRYLSTVYNKLADLDLKRKDYHGALENYQNSLYSNYFTIPGTDTVMSNYPNLDSAYYTFDVSKFCMQQKAIVFHELYKITQNGDYLKYAAEHFAMVDRLEWEYTNKINLSLQDNINQFNEYKLSLSHMLEIAYQSGNELYREQAFDMLARQKSSFLNAGLYMRKVGSTAGASDSLKLTILDLSNAIASKEQQYRQFVSEGSARRSEVLEELFRLQIQQIELRDRQHKKELIDDAVALAPEIDKDLIAEYTSKTSSALIDYFYEGTDGYAFLQHGNKRSMYHVKLNEQTQVMMGQFKRAVKTQSKDLPELSKQLYNLLIEPMEEELVGVEHLAIIPYGLLFEVPFDVLSNDGKLLIEKYTISYNYSIALWLENIKSVPQDEMSLLALAPVFNEKEAIGLDDYLVFASDTIADTDLAFRDKKLKPLPFSAKEVKTVSKLFNKNNLEVKVLLNKEANVENFTQFANGHSILHIATHGVSSKTDADKSGLFFHNNTLKTTGSNFLSIRDFSLLRLDADLVVLSACKTGSGKIEYGEGVLALPRGFIAAGARNVMGSLWKVHDKKTSYLMDQFYRNVLNGVSYSKSLQLAKLACIEKGYFPMDWAGFVLIGN